MANRLTIFLIGCALVVVGCKSAPPAGPSAADVEEGKKAKADMSSKLESMPPDKRAEYIRQHPDEVNKILKGSGIGLGGPRRN
ncbi:MAG: hypothetical protein GC165_07235 [Armatimonadetes bacterium]|nr:hypothetical protein [Armatimonadota bacterium]